MVRKGCRLQERRGRESRGVTQKLKSLTSFRKVVMAPAYRVPIRHGQCLVLGNMKCIARCWGLHSSLAFILSSSPSLPNDAFELFSWIFRFGVCHEHFP